MGMCNFKPLFLTCRFLFQTIYERNILAECSFPLLIIFALMTICLHMFYYQLINCNLGFPDYGHDTGVAAYD